MLTGLSAARGGQGSLLRQCCQYCFVQDLASSSYVRQIPTFRRNQQRPFTGYTLITKTVFQVWSLVPM